LFNKKRVERPAVSYEQLERQRKNAKLYTTLSQQVNCDGSITTLADVTRALERQLDRLQELHTKKYSGKHPDFCMNSPIYAPNDQMCVAIDYCEEQIDMCRAGFVRNFANIHGRTKSPTNPKQYKVEGISNDKTN